MTAITDAAASVLDNYADAIEGGNTYRGSGTAYFGIPGKRSVAPQITELPANALTVTNYYNPDLGVDRGSTSGKIPTDFSNSNTYVRDNAPPFFLVCLTSTAYALNVGTARKITGYTMQSSTVARFTVGTNFPFGTTNGDILTMSVAEGFRRIPNQQDIEQVAPGQFDRTFHLMAGTPKVSQWYGSGNVSFDIELQLRIRLLKHNAAHDIVASAMENLMLMRSILPLPSLRESTYTRALVADPGQSAEIIINDREKVVALDKYTLHLRVSKEFL